MPDWLLPLLVPLAALLAGGLLTAALLPALRGARLRIVEALGHV